MSSLDPVTDGLAACIMPAQSCAVVPVDGNPAETIPATWTRILALFTPGYYLERAFRCDADVFLISKTTGESSARILIGIESGN